MVNEWMPNSAPDAPDQEMSRLSIEPPPRQSYLLPHILLTDYTGDGTDDSGTDEEMNSGTDDESCSEQRFCDTCDDHIGEEVGEDCFCVDGYNLCYECYVVCCFPCARQGSQCEGTEPMLHADVGTHGRNMFRTLEEMGFRLIYDDAQHGTHYCCENCLTEEERQAEAQAEAQTRIN